ncbi:DNA mismatch repair endonuclease MutL [Vulgatibacter sp.]|uniref:DNA mismatch repair endonuclease MutL n=1 Tax=Vulgatibacter sp. TaxID=1971226 RepID=UPI003565B457
MSRIRVLSADVVNKIAAGEVVERPSSVVKEMVENALDAGATRVDVELADGGRQLIKVADDGHGMSREEALLSLERHATSKLRDAEGLFSIASFGFRGEAVPAIASVSRLTLITREPDALEGTRIEIEGGTLQLCEPAGAPRGTSFTIRDLFYAVPARRKFLKRAETESGHATEALIRLALARPDVGFSLRSGGRMVFQSPASTDVRERIAAAIGKEVFPHLLPVEHEHGFFAVRGHVASPEWSAPTNRAIYTYVNGRFVRDRQLLHAVGRAFAEVLPDGRFPSAVIFLDMPPGQVDVNVHPQKMEVRFSDPRGAYEAIYRAISETVRTADWLEAKGARNSSAPAPRHYEVPASPQPVLDWHARARAGASSALQAGEGVREAAAALWPRAGDAEAAGATEPAGFFASLRAIGQLARGYLVCESPAGDLVVLDRHAAHERITFQRLREAWAKGESAGQPFLFPATLELGIADARVLIEWLPQLAQLGFELEPFGGTTFALKAVPSALVGSEYPRVLGDLARELAGAERFDDVVQRLLALVACHGSSRIEQALTQDEAKALLGALDAAVASGSCPHGRPVVAEMSLAELEKRAGRR